MDGMTNLTYSGAWVAVADDLQDDDMVVLAALSDGEVWPAYRDAGIWRYITADPIEASEVLYWTEMLPSPLVREVA